MMTICQPKWISSALRAADRVRDAASEEVTDSISNARDSGRWGWIFYSSNSNNTTTKA